MTKMIPGVHATCPHCAKTVVLIKADFTHPSSDFAVPGEETVCVGRKGLLILQFSKCPACLNSIVHASKGTSAFFVQPRVPLRRPIHTSVPQNLRTDYDEAVLVLNDSAKASAALSRRCLQHFLVLQGAKKHDLVDQLAEIYTTLPSYVQPYVDHIRQLGNISAHPKQSKSTGEIVDVEPGEAEWMLELLEELFDHYYTKPAEAQVKQAALRAKFADAGKLKP